MRSAHHFAMGCCDDLGSNKISGIMIWVVCDEPQVMPLGCRSGAIQLLLLLGPHWLSPFIEPRTIRCDQHHKLAKEACLNIKMQENWRCTNSWTSQNIKIPWPVDQEFADHNLFAPSRHNALKAMWQDLTATNHTSLHDSLGWGQSSVSFNCLQVLDPQPVDRADVAQASFALRPWSWPNALRKCKANLNKHCLLADSSFLRCCTNIDKYIQAKVLCWVWVTWLAGSSLVIPMCGIAKVQWCLPTFKAPQIAWGFVDLKSNFERRSNAFWFTYMIQWLSKPSGANILSSNLRRLSMIASWITPEWTTGHSTSRADILLPLQTALATSRHSSTHAVPYITQTMVTCLPKHHGTNGDDGQQQHQNMFKFRLMQLYLLLSSHLKASKSNPESSMSSWLFNEKTILRMRFAKKHACFIAKKTWRQRKKRLGAAEF